MNCYCCRRDVSLVHRARVRDLTTEVGTSPLSRVSRTAFRTRFVCPACYGALDTKDGIGQVGDRLFKLHGDSRFGHAPLYDRAKYDEYLEAEKLGIAAAN